ncbi:Hypothetical protein GLP15_1620 [Giardia lamblia P15]|uniref:Uncharacterized protein n=1 Tax=Giardia intestinalis (strain P15) TaxID=658858 RepID=E1F7Z0_GIAIA|nr:Hypothetical protein GLP15_1620 [Giardia lamblia P15]
MSRTNLLTKFKHLHSPDQSRDAADPVLALSERLQEVPQLIDRAFSNHERLVRSKPLNFSRLEFTDSSKIQELISTVQDISMRLQIIADCSMCLNMTTKETLRQGCIYARGQMKELFGGLKALVGLPEVLESIRSNLLYCERDIQSARIEAAKTARLFCTLADSNLSVVHSDKTLLGV